MSNKSVSSTATARLKQDYSRLLKDPVPYVRAVPLPSNILTWYYVVTGPENTPYDGGIYFGKLVFPRDFPFKPPSIYMITPNGRFKVNQRLCLSISDFHPDTWNPAWSVSTILTGLLSFMVESSPTSGSIETSDATKRRLAEESKQHNIQDSLFVELFPELTDEIKESIKKKEQAEKERLEILQQNQSSSGVTGATTTTENLTRRQDQNWLFSFLSNIFVMIGLAAFAYIVKYVFNTVN